VKVSVAHRHTLLEAALDAAETRAFPESIRQTASGDVETRAAPLRGTQPAWQLWTRGLFKTVSFEIGLRIPRVKGEAAPAAWAFGLLERLVTRASEIGQGQVLRRLFLASDGLETELSGVAMTVDSLLGPVRTPHDVCPVYLAVGVTKDEEALVCEWNPEALLQVLAHVDPLLLTAPDRASLLTSPRARAAIEQRVEREGSSLGVLHARLSDANVNKNLVSWRLDVETAKVVLSLLKGRIGHQRPFVVRSDEFEVELVPADQAAIRIEGRKAQVRLNQTSARALRSTLRAAPGLYAFEDLPALSVEVVA
jgi:hypothetical protein